MFARVSAFIPRPVIVEFARQLRYNGIYVDEYSFTGFLFMFTGALSLLVAANINFFVELHPAIAFFVSYIGMLFLVYILLKMSSEGKGKFVESILPDALQLISSNMKSGLTTERALFVAGRKEFGSLEVELKNASKRISAGDKVEDSLKEMSDGINSGALKKTIWLISQGIASGGQIADLLIQLADDLKSQQALEEETNSNISIYIMLIFFSAIFGTPVLFAISSFIVQILSKQLASVPTIDLGNIPTSGSLAPIKAFASGTRSAVTPDFVMEFAMIALFVTTIFSCLTIGVINSGKEINGLKFLIPLMVCAFFVFFAVRTVLLLVFGGLL